MLNISFSRLIHLLKQFLISGIAKNKSLILRESQGMKDFMRVLMKPRNTGDKWTSEEIRKIRRHLIRFIFYVPVVIVFLLPFGSLLLPVLAEIMDRRKDTRPG